MDASHAFPDQLAVKVEQIRLEPGSAACAPLIVAREFSLAQRSQSKGQGNPFSVQGVPELSACMVRIKSDIAFPEHIRALIHAVMYALHLISSRGDERSAKNWKAETFARFGQTPAGFFVTRQRRIGE